MYEYTDKVISYIEGQLIERFSRLKALTTFDELNVLQSVNDLYRELGVIIRKAFLKLAVRSYRSTARNKNARVIDEMWVEEILDSYDAVSKYVFTHEEDRKRARTIEALIASDTKAKEIDAALRAMSLMCRIYAVRVTDEAVLQAFKDDGEERAMWDSENDGATCPICLSRDGKVYKISELPPKPHINCRCKYRRVP